MYHHFCERCKAVYEVKLAWNSIQIVWYTCCKYWVGEAIIVAAITAKFF